MVEGYTDVIGLSQAGVENVVATCGTALGEAHFRLFSRFAERAVLSFDSDEAGARAAERAFKFVEQFPVQAVVMIMPEGLDPADFVAKHGADAVRTAATHSRPLVEYMVRRIVERHDLGTIEGQSAAVAEVLPILEGLTDPVRRGEYGHLLAELAGVSESSVMQSLDALMRGHPPEIAKAIGRTSAQDRVEREMLKLLVRDRGIFNDLAGELTEDHFRSTANRRAFDALRKPTATWACSWAEQMRSSPPRFRRSRWNPSTATPRPNTPGVFGDACRSSFCAGEATRSGLAFRNSTRQPMTAMKISSANWSRWMEIFAG